MTAGIQNLSVKMGSSFWWLQPSLRSTLCFPPSCRGLSDLSRWEFRGRCSEGKATQGSSVSDPDTPSFLPLGKEDKES